MVDYIKYKIKVVHLKSGSQWMSEEFKEDRNDPHSTYQDLKYADSFARLSFDDIGGKESVLLKTDILKDCVITLIYK